MNVKDSDFLHEAFHKKWTKKSLVESVKKEVDWNELKRKTFLGLNRDEWDRLKSQTRWLAVDTIKEYFAYLSRITDQPILFLVTARPISDRNVFVNLHNLENSINDQIGIMDFSIQKAKWIALAVHTNDSHYILLLIHSETHTIYCMDSLKTFNEKHPFMTVWKMYTRESQWKMVDFNSPQQKNGDACGVYVCMCAWLLAQGICPDDPLLDNIFEQSHPAFRTKMALDLLYG